MLAVTGLHAIPAVAVTFAISLSILASSKAVRPQGKRSLVLITALIFWAIFSWSYSISDVVADQKLANTLVLIIIPSAFIVLGINFKEGDPTSLVSGAHAFIDVICAVFIGLFFIFSTPYLDGRLMLPGIENPIWVSRFAGVLFLLQAMQWRVGNRKILCLTYLIFLGVILFLGGSRAVALSLMVALIVVGVQSQQKLRIFFLLLLLLGVTSLGYFLGSNSYAFDTNFYSLSYRQVALSNSIEAILHRPWIGYGLGSSGIVLYGEDVFSYPHNLLFEVLLETGVFGFLVLFIPVGIIVRSGRGSPDVAVLLVFLGLNSMSSGDLVGNAALFYTIAYASTLRTSQNMLAVQREP